MDAAHVPFRKIGMTVLVFPCGTTSVECRQHSEALRLSMGRQVPFLLGARKNDERKRGPSLPKSELPTFCPEDPTAPFPKLVFGLDRWGWG